MRQCNTKLPILLLGGEENCMKNCARCNGPSPYGDRLCPNCVAQADRMRKYPGAGGASFNTVRTMTDYNGAYQ